ncbi:MAG: tripartite tricarboxylate transporter substrate binding protein [Rhodospirillaceae bacterium]|jgi:tripartite-type tricarboxylate transporter receptor subunit TctC|nr:tripartite tricarboxylate transporter substrate binding protein [Rhodospirillaceae bacterium]MBT5457143.1 tripartite tricarboxylate transporter substrate binding protein [Rhodospirillaceae bacterium]
MKTSRILVTGLAMAAAAFMLPGQVQAKYPEKPITFIVPFGAGSSFGALARKLGQRWEKELGVPIVVKNLPGSGGRRGGIQVYRSKPDGYTIGWTHFVPFLSDIHLRNKKPSIDIKRVPIIYQISQGTFYMFVGKKTPYRSLADLKKPGRAIKFSSTGIGAITWVQASALGGTIGFPVSFVLGYKKLGDAALAVAKGDAEAGVGGIVHFRPVKDDLRPLIFFGNKRSKKFPNVPSAGELGYKALTNLGAPRVITAPPGTPESKLKVIRAAAIRAVNDKSFVDWAEKTGFFMDSRGPKGTWEGLEAKAEIFKKLKATIDKARKK